MVTNSEKSIAMLRTPSVKLSPGLTHKTHQASVDSELGERRFFFAQPVSLPADPHLKFILLSTIWSDSYYH